jgi:hypothetical protein
VHLEPGHIHEAAVLYAAETIVGSVTINVNAISGANLVMQEVGECPSSQNVDFDDYRVTYVDDEVTALICDIVGADHLYEP